MDITLYTMGSEKNEIYKSLQNGNTLSGYLRGESSVVTPAFIIEHANPSQYNYCYIPDFGRYYFITDITSIRTGLWRISCSVDVLMSYQSQILNLDVIVSDDSLPDNETYFVGEQWQTTVKTKTDVINFPNGLLEQGEYILITSGGVAT